MVLKSLLMIGVLFSLPAFTWAASAAGAPKLDDVKQLGIDGGIHRARLLSGDVICATQAERGMFAFATASVGKVQYLHSELGESRQFYPTIVGGLRAAAIMLDEFSDRVYVFGLDGNATASCGLSDEVLATPFGSPVDILAADSSFKDGFWVLTERGFMLRVNEDGKLLSKFELRRIFKAPEAYFARAGKHGQSLFAFSPNLSKLFEFSSTGNTLKTYDLLSAIGGDLPVTDAVLTDSAGILFTRGRRLFSLVSGHSSELSLRGIDDDAPLFIDAFGSRIIVYNHTGELLIGTLK